MAIDNVTVFTPRNTCQHICIIVRGNQFRLFKNRCEVGVEANPNLSEDEVLFLLNKYPEAKVIFANFLRRIGCWEVQLAIW